MEQAADVPHLIHTRDDYFGLLGRLYALHSGFEYCLNAEVFAASWRALGLDIIRHGRAYLLAADISALAADLKSETDRTGPARPVAELISRPRVPTFGHAMGCLYVLEGSALGGRTVADMVRAAVGEVPTTFLSGAGRRRDRAWPAVIAALRRFEVQGGDGSQVVAGACDTFAAFAVHLRSPRPAEPLCLPNRARSQ